MDRHALVDEDEHMAKAAEERGVLAVVQVMGDRRASTA